MSITLNLSAETERKLRERAAQNGQSFETFVQQLMERAVSAPNGSGTSAGALLPSDAALAAFRQEVTECGMTDDEMLEFFEDAREEAYQEKQNRPGKDS